MALNIVTSRIEIAHIYNNRVESIRRGRCGGIDVIILGNNDLSSFSGWAQNDPRYQDAVIKVHNAALKYGKFFGNAGQQYRSGYTVSADTRMIQMDRHAMARHPAWGRSRARCSGLPPELDGAMPRPRLRKSLSWDCRAACSLAQRPQLLEAAKLGQ